MKTKNILTLFIVVLLAGSCQQNKSAPTTIKTVETEKEIIPIEQIDTFSPALTNQHDGTTVKGKISVTIKNNQAYFFDDEKQIFPRGADSWSIEENYITTFIDKDGRTMLHFFKTGVTLSEMINCFFLDNTFLCQMPDSTYSFYSIEGDEKASHLKDLSYLVKTKNGYATGEVFYVFTKDDHYLFYDETGTLWYETDTNTWLKLLILYLHKQEENEETIHKKTFTYVLDILPFLGKNQI